MLNLDVWLHQQLREQLWKGPARRVGVSLGSYAARRYYAFSAIFENSDRSKSLCSFG
jgi:hypothetical protein